MSQSRISRKYSRTTRNFPRRNHKRIVGDVDGLAIDVGGDASLVVPALLAIDVGGDASLVVPALGFARFC